MIKFELTYRITLDNKILIIRKDSTKFGLRENIIFVEQKTDDSIVVSSSGSNMYSVLEIIDEGSLDVIRSINNEEEFCPLFLNHVDKVASFDEMIRSFDREVDFVGKDAKIGDVNLEKKHITKWHDKERKSLRMVGDMEKNNGLIKKLSMVNRHIPLFEFNQGRQFSQVYESIKEEYKLPELDIFNRMIFDGVNINYVETMKRAEEELTEKVRLLNSTLLKPERMASTLPPGYIEVPNPSAEPENKYEIDGTLNSVVDTIRKIEEDEISSRMFDKIMRPTNLTKSDPTAPRHYPDFKIDDTNDEFDSDNYLTDFSDDDYDD